MCGVSSVMTANELDVCGYDSVVSDEAGNSSGVEMVVSIDYAFLVGGWLSADGDTSMYGAGVARSDPGDNWVMVCARNGSTWLGGRALMRRRFPATRATTDARNGCAAYVIGCGLLIGTWR